MVFNEFRIDSMPPHTIQRCDVETPHAVIQFGVMVRAEAQNVGGDVWTSVPAAKRSNVMRFRISPSIW